MRSYNTAGDCWSEAKSVTVAAGDWTALPTISGASAVTVGNTITLTGSPAGGTWASSDDTKASVNSSTGVVTGVAAGSADITYTTACGTSSAYAVTVSETPVYYSITYDCDGAEHLSANIRSRKRQTRITSCGSYYRYR